MWAIIKWLNRLVIKICFYYHVLRKVKTNYNNEKNAIIWDFIYSIIPNSKKDTIMCIYAHIHKMLYICDFYAR